MSNNHRPVQITPKTIDLCHPSDRLRFIALRTSYIDRCAGNKPEKPDCIAVDHAIAMSACGLSVDEVCCELGWSIKDFQDWCKEDKQIADLRDTMELGLKAHLDRLLNEAIRDAEINVAALQLRMKFHTPMFKEDVICIPTFAKLSLQEKAAKIIDLTVKGTLTLRDTNRLLEALSRIEELAALPDLQKQLIQLQEVVRID